jgi:predicted metal-dependent enzyme (double-stranded beta helix superfamily)
MTHIDRRNLVTGAAVLAAASCSAPRKSRPVAPAAPFDLDAFIEDLERARKERDAQRAVEEVLARAVSDPASVVAELGEPRQAGIHPLHRAPDLTVLNVVWAPLMILLPHEHRMWATIGVYGGREDNILWERSGARVEAASAASLSVKEVFSLPEDAVHSVTNPIERLTGAIHVYGGDFFAVARNEWDAETLSERPFDLENAMRLFEEANRRFEAGREPRGS